MTTSYLITVTELILHCNIWRFVKEGVEPRTIANDSIHVVSISLSYIIKMICKDRLKKNNFLSIQIISGPFKFDIFSMWWKILADGWKHHISFKIIFPNVDFEFISRDYRWWNHRSCTVFPLFPKVCRGILWVSHYLSRIYFIIILFILAMHFY